MSNVSYTELDKEPLWQKVFSDSKFAKNKYSTSQLGFISLFTDSSNKRSVMSHSTRNSKQVTRSVFKGELYAFIEAFDCS